MFSEFLSQNIFWVAAFFIVANLLMWSFLQANVKGVGFVSALELPKLQRSGKYSIIDVNEAAQYTASHIPDAVNFPLSSIKADNKELLKLRDKTAIIVCQSGTKSTKAAKLLVALGFKDCHILRGGMASWTKENLPLQTT